jgi:hypothetical protein
MCDAVQPAQQLASKQKGIHVQIKGRNSIGKQTLAKCVYIYILYNPAMRLPRLQCPFLGEIFKASLNV